MYSIAVCLYVQARLLLHRSIDVQRAKYCAVTPDIFDRASNKRFTRFCGEWDGLENAIDFRIIIPFNPRAQWAFSVDFAALKSKQSELRQLVHSQNSDDTTACSRFSLRQFGGQESGGAKFRKQPRMASRYRNALAYTIKRNRIVV
jgi:hypothetical protein